MGDIIGGIVGGIGSLIGGNQAAKGEQAAAQQALTGYNYLSSNPLINSTQATAQGAQGAQTAALGAEGNTAGSVNQLLTSPDQNNPAFQNYLKSTGYNFQQQQGTAAITGNAAAKGLLNSGATAKALQGYGQNLASTTFNNYLTQMGGLAGLQANTAAGYGGQVGQGISAAQLVGQAGSTGGANAGQQTAAAGQSQGSSFANAANVFGGGIQNSVNNGSFSNFFGTPAAPPPNPSGYVPSGFSGLF